MTFMTKGAGNGSSTKSAMGEHRVAALFVPLNRVQRLHSDPATRVQQCIDRIDRLAQEQKIAQTYADKFGRKADAFNARGFGHGIHVNLEEIERTIRSIHGPYFYPSKEELAILREVGFDYELLNDAKSLAEEKSLPIFYPTAMKQYPVLWSRVNPRCTDWPNCLPQTYSGWARPGFVH